jgi:membrane-bound serine protease (ClpP class)
LLNIKTIPLEVSVSLGWAWRALARSLGSLFLATVGLVALSRFLPATRLGRRLVLKSAITATAGAASAQVGDGVVEAMVGRAGEAETALRPAGKVRIAGARYDVVTDGEYVDAGAPVEVIEVDGSRIVVRKVRA